MILIIVFLIVLLTVVLCFNKKKVTQPVTIDIKSNVDIPIYVISLEKDHVRRENLYKKINPVSYYAVDGSKLNLSKLKKKKIISSECKLKRGEIGCYMSHYEILEKIKNEKDNYTLILEDDAEFNTEELNKIDKICKSAPKDWEIIYLGQWNTTYTGQEIQIPNTKYTLKGITGCFGTYGYLVKNKRIKQKLNLLYPITEPYDVVLPTIFNSYIVDPCIIKVGNYGSNTQGII